MFVVITSIKLKSPYKFFALSYHALNIIKQLKLTNNKAYKSRGFWTMHYTMSLWENSEDMQAFARSGAHKAAMQKSASIANEITTLKLEVSALPDWKTAKSRLINEGKKLTY